jgi:hypothetical protein
VGFFGGAGDGAQELVCARQALTTDPHPSPLRLFVRQGLTLEPGLAGLERDLPLPLPSK